MVSWNEVRHKILEIHGHFVSDPLYLSLNYGNCYNQGKHPNTSDNHWDLFRDAILLHEPYSEERCLFLFGLLDDAQKEILRELLEL